MNDENRAKNKKLFRILLLLFAASYLMSNGPGVLLVNRPVLLAGIPLLYLWGLGWAVVQIGLILYAYFRIWRHEIEPGTTGPGVSGKAEEAGS
ncbi:MAG: hypothetical protein JXQ83_04225 [Candidatus Glassbacteria bacterium]|nr:hypothetical protein [Candidatus Glassbacteria bacterium]